MKEDYMIDKKYEFVLFAFLMAAFMAGFMSFIVTLINIGFVDVKHTFRYTVKIMVKDNNIELQLIMSIILMFGARPIHLIILW